MTNILYNILTYLISLFSSIVYDPIAWVSGYTVFVCFVVIFNAYMIYPYICINIVLNPEFVQTLNCTLSVSKSLNKIYSIKNIIVNNLRDYYIVVKLPFLSLIHLFCTQMLYSPFNCQRFFVANLKYVSILFYDTHPTQNISLRYSR